MFKNKIVIFIMLGVALLSIGIASAQDSSSLNTTELCNDEVESSDDVVIEESGSKTFRDLQTEINGNNTLVLEDDYKYGGSGDVSGITISKNNFIIDGQGHTIDGNNQVRIFNVRANNVTLKNLILINGNTSGDGAAICANANQFLIDNCTFINNTAYYGGAIYSTSVEIKNSKFISNTASGCGGAIAVEKNSAVSVDNTIFKDCQSVDNAGGAVYTISSDLEVKNSDFINCSANFAGAICSLNSAMTITNTNFTNNTARYEGGAIYKMYGTGNISKSNFTKNTALNGGAVFSDNCTIFEITNTEFISNIAVGYGGAIFANANPKLTFETVTFNDNKASYYDNLLNQSNFSPIVSSSNNYSLFVYKSSFNGTLPDKYSLVDDGYVTPVQNQLSGGNCWAFAALASLESCILKASNKTFVFSTENMKNLMSLYSAYGWNMETNGGGYNTMALSYFPSWLGPVNATLDKYDYRSTLSPVLESEIHIQNIYVLPPRNNYTDNNAIKEAILKYGGVFALYYNSGTYYNSNTKGYYYSGTDGANHAICVVGWDDNYSKDNFNSKPAGDGAFLIKNSWGSNMPYFYISYYDAVLFKMGADSRGFTFILNDTVRYTKNYQYDIAGMTDYLITGNNTIWYQNIYNATGDETIAAVSTYFNTTVDYEISVYVNGILKTTQNGTQENGGYYTIPLNKSIPVSVGDTFKVVVKLTNPKTGYAVVPISEYIVSSASATRCYYAPGVSYFSLDGTTWNDLYNYTYSNYGHTYKSQVACIKAFTISEMRNTTITLNNVSPKVQEFTEITATVVDSNGDLVNIGNVIFNIDGNNYTAGVVNGVAKVNVTFNKAGDYVISAVYQNNTLYNKSGTQMTVNVVKGDVNLSIAINNIIYGGYPIANINLTSITGTNLTDNVILRINNKNYTVNVINGSATFTVSEILNATQYQAIVDYLGSNKYNIANSSVNFTVAKKEINMTFTIDKDYRDITVNVNLSEKLDGNLTLLVNNNPYVLNYINGTVSYTLKDLTPGNYTIVALFTKDNYKSVNVSENIEIIEMQNTTITLNNIAPKVQEIIEITADVVDSNGNLVNMGNVIFNIDGNNYTASVSNGVAKVNVEFNKAGDYVISAVYQNNTFYNKSSTQMTVNVVKGDVNLSIAINNIIYGEYPIANINLTSITGTNLTDAVILRINNKNYTVDVINGSAIFTIPEILNATQYQAIVDYLGSNKYNIATNFVNFTVAKKEITMNLTIDENYGDITVNVNLSEKLDGNLTLLVNNTPYILNYINGTVSYTLKNLTPGNYTIVALFTKDNYKSVNASENIEIAAVKTILDVKDVIMYYHNGTRFIVNLKDINGNPLANMNVSILINGNTNIRQTNENGTVSIALNLVSGVYRVVTTFDGTSKYFGNSVNNTVTILSTIAGNDITKYFRNATQYCAFVSDFNGNPLANTDVSFNINGVFYTRTTDDKGYARLSINLNPGEYIITVINKITDEQTSNNITVLSKIVDNHDLVKYYKNESKFHVKVLDDQGNPVKGETVTFNINGVFYSRETDLNGIAGLAINLNPGNYVITTIYSQYEVSNNIEVLPTLKTQDLTMTYQDGSKFKATLLDGQGNPLANQIILYNVNGIFYNRTTDSNGIANLNINLMRGEYIITSYWNDYQTGNTIKIL